MSHGRSLGLLVLLACATGCHRHHHARGPEGVVTTDNGAAPAPAPAAPVDNRNAGQVIVDILAQQGYTCTAEETRWDCTTQNDPGWTFYVSYVTDESQNSTIWVDSYAFRAFGHRCDEYTNHMADLGVVNDGFVVTCDDSTQQFRMNTALKYDSTLDVPGWTQNHLSHRTASLDLLRKAHAIRK